MSAWLLDSELVHSSPAMDGYRPFSNIVPPGINKQQPLKSLVILSHLKCMCLLRLYITLVDWHRLSTSLLACDLE